MLFHIIHILILTLDPNPNPKLKKKKNPFFPYKNWILYALEKKKKKKTKKIETKGLP